MAQKDLTRGAVSPTLCFFALPMILGNVLQQGYNIVDTWVVGQYAGSDALAAVGAAFALMTFLTSVLLGLCMGSGVVFSLCFGRQDEEGLKKGICASALLVAAVAALLTASALWATEPILVWMRIPTEIREITREYLVLIFWGIPAVALYNFFGAYLRAVGNSVADIYRAEYWAGSSLRGPLAAGHRRGRRGDDPLSVPIGAGDRRLCFGHQ